MKFILKMIFFSLMMPVLLLFSSCTPKSVFLEQAPDPRGLARIKGTAKFTPQVDILFVIDNSGSMSAHQNKLKSNIKLYINEMSKSASLDYHIGVVTTDVDNITSLDPGKAGNLVRENDSHVPYIDKATANGLKLLEQNLLVGIGGSITEKVFDPVFLALSNPTVRGMNRGFYRSSAYLALIVITDAEDQSQRIPEPETLFTFLLGLKNNDPSKILSYGAIVPVKKGQNTGCSRDEGVVPTKIERFFQLTNSIYNENWFDICSDDYGPKLAQIAKNLVRKVSKYIYLDQIPDIQTLKVRYGSKEIPNDDVKGWTFDPFRNAVVLADTINWDSLTMGKTGQVEVDFTPADAPR